MSRSILNSEEVIEILNNKNNDFVLIQNPEYIFPDFEIVPLSKKINRLKDVKAIVMDMDGTTTTTEELCIHSLEYMVRKCSGLPSKDDWIGLDHIKDYPHIIGNSTTKHVEYLVNTYNKSFKPKEVINSFIYAALWTLLVGQDEGRKKDIIVNLNNLNIQFILLDRKYIALSKKATIEDEKLRKLSNYFSSKIIDKIKFHDANDYVKMAIDIYYQRYHEILIKVKSGEGKQLSEQLLGNKEKHLIEPMPGVGLFILLVKGLCDKEIIDAYKPLLEKYSFYKKDNANVKYLSQYFTKNPAKIAVVTSSIFYEADIVMAEVFKVLTTEIKKLKISKSKKLSLTKLFSNYKNVYDAFITASDSNEIRLKPHRDLYSIALFQLGIQKKDFNKVIGLEDSESGTIAIRAAGINLCCSVPFAKTSGHNLEASSYCAIYGLPEVILKKNCFMKVL